MLSAVVLSKPCGRSNTHRAQKTLKGEGNVRGREEEKGGGSKRNCLSFLPITFLLCSKLPPAGQVYKTTFTKPAGPWLATLKAEEHSLHG